MKDIEQAKTFLMMAKKDHLALTVMTDEEKIAVEIFGFHVQQTVEKTLKALLCIFGVKFPKIHDLDELAAMLQDAKKPLPELFLPLLAYTDFAVTFRYDAFPEFEAKINREQTIVSTGQLISYVEKLLEDSSIS